MLDPYIESILIFSGINIVLALSLYLPVSAGLLSLGQGGFMAIGAYVSGYMTSVMDWPFAVALICGGLVAGAVGFLVGIPSLRIKGVYLIIMTLGFGEIVRVFFLNFEPTGGASGYINISPLTTLRGLAATCVVVFLALWRLRTTAAGRAMIAVREDETAAEAMGINLLRLKLATFAGGA